MTNDDTQVKNEGQAAPVESGAAAPVAAATPAQAPRGRRPQRGGKGGGSRFRGPRPDRPKAEYDQKTLSVRRVTRVASGGRRFTFSVVLVIGDKNGRVAIGVGKGADTALAIQKAFNNGKKNLVLLKRTDNNSIPHESEAKFKTSKVILWPNRGRGLVAGSSVRSVLEMAGLKDITARVLSRSKNPLNNARATMQALDLFVSARGTEARKPVKKEAVVAETLGAVEVAKV